jgi:hypothetical protein
MCQQAATLEPASHGSLKHSNRLCRTGYLELHTGRSGTATSYVPSRLPGTASTGHINAMTGLRTSKACCGPLRRSSDLTILCARPPLELLCTVAQHSNRLCTSRLPWNTALTQVSSDWQLGLYYQTSHPWSTYLTQLRATEQQTAIL